MSSWISVSPVAILKAGKTTGKYCSLRKQGKYFPVLDNQVSRWPITAPDMLIRPHPHNKVDQSSMSSSHLDFYIDTGSDNYIYIINKNESGNHA